LKCQIADFEKLCAVFHLLLNLSVECSEAVKEKRHDAIALAVSEKMRSFCLNALGYICICVDENLFYFWRVMGFLLEKVRIQFQSTFGVMYGNTVLKFILICKSCKLELNS
jgi:hypothetical protein